MQDKNTPELPGHFSTRMVGIFSTFPLLGFTGRWGAWIVLLASLLITFNAWYFARDEVAKRAQARFDFRVKTIEAEIYERLQAYELLLRGGAGLFTISDEITREDWRTYVAKLLINQYYPGIQGVGFSKQILPSEKATHLRQIRGEGFPQYTIKPDGQRPEYTSIIFLEPFDWRNQRAFGYDMFSEPTRKEAMIRARDTGVAALSGKVTLVQETAKDIQAGFLIYLAIYRKGEPQETLEQRRKALMGYVYSPFRMHDFMKGILAEKEGYVDLQIFNGDKPLKEAMLYRSDTAEEPHNHPEGHHFATNQSILEYAGHRWLLSFVSSKYFEENLETGSTNFILVLGAVISLLLFGMVLSFGRSRRQAIALANTTLDLEKANIGLREEIMERKQAEELLHKSEEKLRNILEYSPNLFYSHTAEHELTYLSPQCRQFLQCEPEEAMVRWTEFATDNPINESGFRLTEKAIKTGIRQPPYDMELMGVKGRKIWVEVREAPILEDGKTVAIVGSAIDVTQRKQAEAALRESDERYRGLFDHSLEMVYLCDFEGNFIDANDAALEGLGYTRKDLKSLNFMSLLDIDQFPRAMEQVEGILKNGSQENVTEFQLKRKDGELVYIESKGALIYRDGNPVSIQGIARNITQRKYLEEEQEKLIHELQQALKEVKQLGRLLPICSHCKKIRDDKGYWNQIETYIQDHSDTEFSHGICRECAEKFYPDMDLYGD